MQTLQTPKIRRQVVAAIVLASLASLVGLSARADSEVSIRPSKTATLEVTETVGQLDRSDAQIDGLRVTMLESSGLRSAVTGFEVAIRNKSEIQFRNVSQEVIACGSISYTATATNEQTGQMYRFQLVDHTSRICDDAQPATWIAKVELVNPVQDVELGYLTAEGNPEPVYSIDF